MKREKYIIHKGWQGFGDRLQCLSYAVSISKSCNRSLIVDWGDRIWTHDEKGFYDYFWFWDIQQPKKRVPDDASVHPSFWQGILEKQCDDWCHNIKDWLELRLDLLPTQDVWVLGSVGFRRWDFNQLVQHLRMKPDVARGISKHLEHFDPSMPVVHLRGTDKAFSEEIWQRLRQSAPVAQIVSDDLRLVNRWLKESPDSIVLTDTLVASDGGGHLLPSDQLPKTKYEMNIRLLADFLILSKAKQAYGLVEDSSFFEMARLFGTCGGFEKVYEASL